MLIDKQTLWPIERFAIVANAQKSVAPEDQHWISQLA
jgi:hypothetical protein